jgi:tetratricopeptide (TPR) repeat protein
MSKLTETWTLLGQALRKFWGRMPTSPSRRTDFDEYLALHAKGAYREAYAVLRDILDTNPYWSQIGDLYVWCAGFEMQIGENTHKARQLLEKAWQLGCQHPADYYSELGFVRWRMGEHEEGIRDLEESVALDPTVTHLIRLGELLAIEGDTRGHAVLQRVLDLEPRHCLAHVYLGILACKSGDRDEAMILAEKAERLGESAIDYLEVGRLYRELEEFQAACDAYLKVDRLGYDNKGRLYASLAVCYGRLGDKETGKTYLERAIKYDPEDEYVRSVAENEYREKGEE